MDLSALHASQTLCHICLPFKIHNLLLPRKEDYLLVGPLFTENLSESDFQLLLAEYGVKPTEDLLIYFHSLTSMEEESFQRLLHYLSEELGKPFTEITLSRPPKALSRPESFSLIQESDQISHNYACQYMDCVRNFSLQNQEALAASMQTWEGTLALAPAPLFSYMKELVFTEFLLLSSVLHEHLEEHAIPTILYHRQQLDRCATNRELSLFHHAFIHAFQTTIHTQTEPGFSDGIAAACHLSKSYLSTRFHKECGQTISDYLLSCRMEQAKKLLRYSSLPIGEVADQCGIGDGSYFAKCFTKWVGMGPEKWRGKK